MFRADFILGGASYNSHSSISHIRLVRFFDCLAPYSLESIALPPQQSITPADQGKNVHRPGSRTLAAERQAATAGMYASIHSDLPYHRSVLLGLDTVPSTLDSLKATEPRRAQERNTRIISSPGGTFRNAPARRAQSIYLSRISDQRGSLAHRLPGL